MPESQRLADFVGFAGGAEFPHERAVWWEPPQQFGEVEHSGERHAVVARGPLDVVHMAADQVWGDPFQPLFVVDQAEVVFQLDVAKIVPVADLWVIGEMLLQAQHFAFGGHVLEA